MIALFFATLRTATPLLFASLATRVIDGEIINR